MTYTVAAHVSKAQWRTQPWKNGRGVTHEVLRSPDADDYAIRFSVAEIEGAQPFSSFATYQRILVPLRETTLQLAVDDAVYPMPFHDIVAWSGAARAATIGAGFAYDLNVIGQRFVASIGLRPPVWLPSESQRIAVFALEAATLTTCATSTVALATHDLVVLAPGTSPLSTQSSCALAVAAHRNVATSAPAVWVVFPA